jgi:hypothetical protein
VKENTKMILKIRTQQILFSKSTIDFWLIMVNNSNILRENGVVLAILKFKEVCTK